MNHHRLAVLTLAAGKGTRMHAQKPKCLHSIAHRPMVLHAMDAAKKLNPERLICVVGDDQKDLETLVAQEGAQICVQKERKGTAHAVSQAKNLLEGFQGIILITYGDTPLVRTETLDQLISALQENPQAKASVMGFSTDHPGGYGRLVLNEQKQLTHIVEAKEANQDELNICFVNSGFMALRAPECWDILEQIDNQNQSKEYYLTDYVSIAHKAGFPSVATKGDKSELQGVNTKVELSRLETLMQERLREDHMLSGVTLLDPSSVYFSYDTQIAADVTIEPHVYFGLKVQIGANSHIKAYSHIEDTIIGENVNVGPFARLRPGAYIEDHCHIGNFVEIKKAHISHGAKINHLSYIGDATVGERSNVGAGTITCNYDGFFKYQTQIGADVFVGSNTAFIAPVCVGDGVTTAAGSVITNDIESESLAIARSRQKEIKGWSTTFRQKQKIKKDAQSKK